ncbi:MAG: ATP-binding protein [Cyanothece sp. SIO2G6]|nr:ATP-binding protein [Cyanothece sp. SIO2G6]
MAMDWQQANQQYLMRAIAQIHHLLQQQVQPADNADSQRPPPDLDEIIFPENQCSAIDTLSQLFGLSSFERHILLLCAGVEFSRPIADLCATLNGSHQEAYATFGLALALFPEFDWEALTPKAPLRSWHLLEVGGGTALTTSPLRIDERILHYLLGIQQLDERLNGIVSWPHHHQLVESLLPPSYQRLVQDIVQTGLQSQAQSHFSQHPVIQLCGPDSSTKQLLATIACQQVGRSLHIITADALPTELNHVNLLQRLCEREVLLSQTIFLLDCDPLAVGRSGENGSAVLNGVIDRLIERLQCPVLVMRRDRHPQRQRPLITIDVHPPTPTEQQYLWVQLLGESTVADLNGHINQLVTNFNLSPSAIQTVIQTVQQHVNYHQVNSHYSEISSELSSEINHEISNETSDSAKTAESLSQLLWNACLTHARPQLNDLAQPICSTVDWDSLVLPAKEKAVLQTIHTHVKWRSTVYEEWGFASKSRRGLGISALFAGASGTGKTLAAEVLANALHLDLYRIDLSAVVSKYIGETEKNLRRIFDVAETGGAVLLFDEADALFGKRSEVNDSRDRYANMEVAYLLQRIESYRGLAILTTNLQKSMDQAFLRRIRFIVQFPFPDAKQRQEIWRRAFPPNTPIKKLSYEKLAQLNVSGGNIRNIALNAAFLAADAGEAVQMRHLLQAAESEYIKLERPLTEVEVKGWISGRRRSP